MISNGKRHDMANPCSVLHSEGLRKAPYVRGSEALRELLAAYMYSQQANHGVWDFAVTVDELRSRGLTESDLRWLVCEGIVQHACEVTRIGDDTRQFQPTHPLVFTRQDCVILTERGIEFARSLCDHHAVPEGTGTATAPLFEPITVSQRELSENAPRQPTGRPHWEPDRHELRLNGVIVKQFKWPAANQETVLAAFQEEDWPFRIDDPLPPQPDQDPKRRLSDTVKCLNRKQRSPLIHFRGDGSGEGVIWEFVESR